MVYWVYAQFLIASLTIHCPIFKWLNKIQFGPHFIITFVFNKSWDIHKEVNKC
jgi:hypothetical protein